MIVRVLRLVIQPRAVAQLGSAPDWGSGGRRFKSCQPDVSGLVRLCLTRPEEFLVDVSSHENPA